jgi:hypothetical protein
MKGVVISALEIANQNFWLKLANSFVFYDVSVFNIIRQKPSKMFA